MDWIEDQLISRGIQDPAVLEAMKRVPRHRFVPDEFIPEAYSDGPLPIGCHQTISQPYIVAYMSEVLNLKPDMKVLEVGTGSGYQAAVLAEIVSRVITVERISVLAQRAADLLNELGYSNIRVITDNGYKGCAEEAPFDAILSAAAMPHIPDSLQRQLKRDGGRIITPVGPPYDIQFLQLGWFNRGVWKLENLIPVRFVPFISEHFDLP